MADTHTDDFNTDGEFRGAVGDLLDELLDQIDDIDTDLLDPRLTTGNLHVTFEDTDAVFILSQQTPTHELWLSANMTAWHFLRSGGVWVERDTGEPMMKVLGGLFTDKLGVPVTFEL